MSAQELELAPAPPARPERMHAPAPAAASVNTPGQLLAFLMTQGGELDIDRLERLLDLQVKYEANEARKAYVAAMAEFKAEPLVIKKDKHVSFQTAKGLTEYDHATLGNVVKTIVAGLGRHGFSHSWDVKRGDQGRIFVTCRITHALGHSEAITLDAAADDSGSKNNIQAMGSTVSYLSRYTLLAITGLATEDQDDDDGRSAEPVSHAECIPELSAEDLAAIEQSKADILHAKNIDDLKKVWKDTPEHIRAHTLPFRNIRVKEIDAAIAEAARAK